MHQSQPRFGTDHGRNRGWQLRQHVHRAFFSLGWIQENLFVEPLDPCEIEAINPIRKEELEELEKEFVNQGFEKLIVVGHPVFLLAGEFYHSLCETASCIRHLFRWRPGALPSNLCVAATDSNNRTGASHAHYTPLARHLVLHS